MEDPRGVANFQEEILYGRSVAVQDGLVEGEDGPSLSRFVADLREFHLCGGRLYFPLALDWLLPVTWQTVIVHEIEDGPVPEIRFHDLRHTCATLLLGRGVHPKIVQELLGHATIAMTLDTYSHYLPSMGDQASGAMGGAFG